MRYRITYLELERADQMTVENRRGLQSNNLSTELEQDCRCLKLTTSWGTTATSTPASEGHDA